MVRTVGLNRFKYDRFLLYFGFFLPIIEPIRTSPNKSKNTTTTAKATEAAVVARTKRLPSSGCDENGCFIPKGDSNSLPPIYLRKDESNCDFDYKEVGNNQELVKRLQSETLRFALEKNFFVDVKILNCKCK